MEMQVFSYNDSASNFYTVGKPFDKGLQFIVRVLGHRDVIQMLAAMNVPVDPETLDSLASIFQSLKEKEKI